ncbi:MAG: ATP-dependent sacrificial sulfur transferase LarE [Terriglobales bacterium]
MGDELEQKRHALEQRLRECGRTLVAYSGGIDSAYLAFVASRVLGSGMLAVLADSPSLARSQYADALAFAEEQHIPLRVVQTSEMENPEYVRNSADRCFHCKDELFSVMERLAEAEAFATIAYGMNCDDRGDFRPGQRAARNHGVAAPLVDAGLGKAEVRELARRAGLRVWEKPASACLSSRIEYGRPVTAENLAAVEGAEELLRELGFRIYRVRHHGEISRIEVAREEMPALLAPEMVDRVIAGIKALGFKFVTIDLEGYRSGSMNTVLPVSELMAAGKR